MSRSHHRHHRFKLRSFYVWHRYMGVSAALFVLVIASTGLMLNHTEDLAFDSRFVKADWVLDWYGIGTADAVQCFAAGEQQVILLGEQLYRNYRRIPGEYRKLSGAVLLDDMLVVAADNALLLLTADGELVERLQHEDGVPADIQKLGSDKTARVFAHTGAGIYASDSELLRWSEWGGKTTSIRWAQTSEPEAALLDSLQKRYRGEILPLERVVLDLHSGRFFGRYGVWLFDIAAVALILLALSGTLIWLRRKR